MYRQWFSGNDVTIDLVWHLVNTYCVTVNEQYGAIVCVDNFIERLESKQCSRSLCCAVLCVRQACRTLVTNHSLHDV